MIPGTAEPDRPVYGSTRAKTSTVRLTGETSFGTSYAEVHAGTPDCDIFPFLYYEVLLP